jgi:hypothetical protein
MRNTNTYLATYESLVSQRGMKKDLLTYVVRYFTSNFFHERSCYYLPTVDDYVWICLADPAVEFNNLTT